MGAFIVVVCLSTYVITIYRVDGESMLPTYRDGSFIPVLLTPNQQFDRGDVVVIEYQGETKIRFVKRLTGLPGDTVVFKDDSLTLDVEEYFVEGDNSSFSTDSRNYGPIKQSQIIGKVLHFKQ